MSGSTSATITDDQSAARELVRTWAAASGAVDAARDVEHGDPDAWRRPYDGLAQLGTFGVALPEEHGGADGTVGRPVRDARGGGGRAGSRSGATTALATLVLSDAHAEVLEALAAGQRTAGARAQRRIDLHRRPGVGHCALRARRRRGWRAAAAGGRPLGAGRRRRCRRHGRTADGHRLLPAAGSCGARRRGRRGRRCRPAAGGRPGGDGGRRGGRRPGALDAADRDRVRQGPRTVRQADRQFPGHQAHVRGDAAALGAGGGGRGRRGPGGGRGR